MKRIAMVFVVLFTLPLLAILLTGCGRQQRDTFRIGAFLPLSGSNAAYGNEARMAMEMAVRMINNEGGFNGQAVELIVYDSMSSPEEAVRVVSRLIEVHNINAALTSILSSEIMATGRTLNDARVLTFGLGTSPTFMQQDWPFMFRAVMNVNYGMRVSADMLQTLGMTRVAAFSGLDEANVATLNAITNEAAARGIQIVASETHQYGDTDFSAQIARIIASNPDVVFVSTMGSVTPIFIRQLRNLGYTGIIQNRIDFSVAMVEVAGRDVSSYIMFASPYVTYEHPDDSDIPIVRQFLWDFYNEFGVFAQTEIAYRAWDSMMALWQTARLADSNLPEDIRRAASQVRFDALGGTLDFTRGDREGYQTFNSFMMIDGRRYLFEYWVRRGGYEAYQNGH